MESSLEEKVEHNISQLFDKAEGRFVLRVDELATTPRARYYSKFNEIVGFCYNHKDEISCTFCSWSDIQIVRQAFIDKRIHLAKKALFYYWKN